MDGWILLAPDAGQMERAQNEGMPVVVVNGSGEGFLSIDLDNVGAGRAVTAHLVDQGHRRIGFIAGKSEMANARDRLEGYRLVLEQYGIPWDPALVIEGRFAREGGRTAMTQLLRLNMPPTAVFAANDLMALGARDVLKGKNIRVPQSMALAGFDDIPAAEAAGLTSVRQPLAEMSRQAGIWLRDWLRSGRRAAEENIIVQGLLIVRGSSSHRHLKMEGL